MNKSTATILAAGLQAETQTVCVESPEETAVEAPVETCTGLEDTVPAQSPAKSHKVPAKSQGRNHAGPGRQSPVRKHAGLDQPTPCGTAPRPALEDTVPVESPVETCAGV